ncbi:hypothetical protein D3C73_1404010 [compost metagenome]
MLTRRAGFRLLLKAFACTLYSLRERTAMKLHTLTKAITLATLLSAGSLSAYAADIPLSAVVEANQVVTEVISVDEANRLVVLKGAEGQPVKIQMTE